LAGSEQLTLVGLLGDDLLSGGLDREIRLQDGLRPVEADLNVLSLFCSCLFRWVPVLSGVSSGFTIIICTLIAALFGAWLLPIEEEVQGKCPVVVLSGPSHAEEVGRKIPTAVVAAADDIKHAEFVQDLFMNSRFRVYTSTDRVGAEICAALKNVIALCAGCCDGMGYGDNTKAMLMTRGLAEIARLGIALGGKQESFTGLTGVGDLIVTCCSMHSRNRRCGILIGQGTPVEQALKEIGAVVEGYYAAANARTLALKAGVEMPIAQAAYEVLYEGRDAHSVVDDLMGRAKRAEHEN